MNSNNLKQAIGIFPNPETAQQAMLELQNINFPMHSISVVTKTANPRKRYINRTGYSPVTRAAGAKAGAILGSAGVGLTTLTIGLGILLVPGIGSALAIESLLTAVLGSGIAATAGGLHGAFLGYVDPEKQAKIYQDPLKQEDCFVVIEATENQILSAEPILRHFGVRAWHVYDTFPALNNKSQLWESGLEVGQTLTTERKQ